MAAKLVLETDENQLQWEVGTVHALAKEGGQLLKNSRTPHVQSFAELPKFKALGYTEEEICAAASYGLRLRAQATIRSSATSGKLTPQRSNEISDLIFADDDACKIFDTIADRSEQFRVRDFAILTIHHDESVSPTSAIELGIEEICIVAE